MKHRDLYAIWAGLAVLCIGLGFLPNPTGLGKAALVLLGIAFFVPGGLLLYRARRDGDRSTASTVFTIAACSLAATVVMLIANVISAVLPEAVGNIFHVMLVIVSVPMVCTQYWLLSLFLWACLMFTAAGLRGKK